MMLLRRLFKYSVCAANFYKEKTTDYVSYNLMTLSVVFSGYTKSSYVVN